jgi:hypothetical protein
MDKLSTVGKEIVERARQRMSREKAAKNLLFAFLISTFVIRDCEDRSHPLPSPMVSECVLLVRALLLRLVEGGRSLASLPKPGQLPSRSFRAFAWKRADPRQRGDHRIAPSLIIRA